MKPLNPALYDALETALGGVTIANEGEEARIIYRPDWGATGQARMRGRRVVSGEYYKVSCPFCNDTRGRLWVNYQWGVRDPETGDLNLHLANCFNEGCIDRRDRQLNLANIVYPMGLGRPAQSSRGPRPGVKRVHDESAWMPEIRLPEGLVPINALPPSHHAAEYLHGRGYDLDELWTRWGVAYCAEARSGYDQVVDRIVAPIFGPRPRFGPEPEVGSETLLGWQARYVGPPSYEAKYLSARGMKKSRLLYGLSAAAATTGLVVVCEGVTGVWKLRTGAVAILGKALSQPQRDLIRLTFGGRPIVLFFDRDARKEAEEARRVLLGGWGGKLAPGRVVIAEPPAGRGDVGDCTCEEAWGQVAAALGRPLGELGLTDGARPRGPDREPEPADGRVEDWVPP